MAEKLKAIDHLRPLMNERAVLFGATILGRGILPNAAARSLLRLYNAKGVSNNLEDDLAALSDGLNARFNQVNIETSRCVALFRARSFGSRRPLIAINLPLTIQTFTPLAG